MTRLARTLFDLLVRWRRRRQQRRWDWRRREFVEPRYPTIVYSPAPRTRLAAIITQHESRVVEMQEAIDLEKQAEDVRP